MKFNNIYFVGFFKNYPEKLKFSEMFEYKKRFFLESSKKYRKSRLGGDTKFFPMLIYSVLGSKASNLLFNTVKINPLFIKLYKRDLRVYLNSHINNSLPGRSAGLILVYWLFRKEFKCRSFLNLFGYLAVIKGLNGRNRGGSFRERKALKMLAFRLSFISGYLYTDKLISQLSCNNNDLFVLWGCESSGLQLLSNHLENIGIKYLIVEYGEIPGTYSISKNGIFGDSFIAENWSKIINTKVDKNKLDSAEKYLDQVIRSGASSRGNDLCSGLLSYYQAFFAPIETHKKIIYVSGVELISSGHLFNKDYIGPETLNANRALLKNIVSNFSSDDYIIIYKDHPLMQKNFKELTLGPDEFKSVLFLNGVGVDYLIPISDITITLPSKVVMTSLMYRKPVYVFGKFSIPMSVPELGYYTGNNIDSIKEVIHKSTVDSAAYTRIVASMLDDYLVCVESPLFEKYSLENEQSKLNKIISSQL